MKTLKDHIILYDQECPMCSLYTGAFVKTGMLEKDGARAPYQQMPAVCRQQVNTWRAVNEIALVNTRTGKVLYGVDSLFSILGNAFPVFQPLFRWKPFHWLMQKLYHFISYNRRVIMPAAVNPDQSWTEPGFHRGYRALYMVFAWLVSSLILADYASRFGSWLPAGSFYREVLICAGQIMWQGLALSRVGVKKRWNYLGNMMTISLAGALLLGIISLVLGWFSVTEPFIYLMAFGLVVGLMFLEHLRRCRLLGLPAWLTPSWVLYRVLVLIILLN